MKTKRAVHNLSPLSIPPLTKHDVIAIKNLNRGEADAAQQIHAMDVILKKLCNIGGISFDEHNPRLTDLREGKKLIATQLLAIIQMQLEDLTS